MANEHCPICNANALRQQLPNNDILIQCDRCGNFQITRKLSDDWPYERNRNSKAVPLACHLIRKYQRSGELPRLEAESFMEAIKTQSLPRPAEAANQLVLWVGSRTGDNPGQPISVKYDHLAAEIGVAFESDVRWLANGVAEQGLVKAGFGSIESDSLSIYLTFDGWNRFDDLRRSDRESRFAFMARKFANTDLDKVVELCLRPAVADTGYELRTVTQRAGLIDVVIESEIRNCRFLVADLSDANDGAYWEAGFAEGLGKPIFYVCKDKVPTHFDTNHRNTVFWNLGDLNQAKLKLKALIRNTLLGDAKQSDEA